MMSRGIVIICLCVCESAVIDDRPERACVPDHLSKISMSSTPSVRAIFYDSAECVYCGTLFIQRLLNSLK